MAISRKAILIGAPSVNPALPGVKIDINDIRKFLLSDRGGAWRPDEIVTLLDKSSSDVYRQLEMVRNVDYVFITCSGHGEHVRGQGIDETLMYLGEKDKISINSINPRNKRHLVIADVCRVLVPLLKDEMREMMKASVFARVIKAQIDYRKVFDDAVMLNPEGRIVAYSCSIDQAAGDDGTGGVFTQELLIAPSNFTHSNSSGYGIVRIDQAFERAKNITYKKNAPQTPVLNAGRRMQFYPFAII